MSYGIQSFFNSTIKNLDQSMVGGRVFVKFINEAYVSGGPVINISIPNVSSHTYLKVYTISAGSHSITTLTVSGVATVRLTPRSHLAAYGQNTVLIVFATQTTEPTYGVLSTNDNNERLVSTIYPISQFLEKVTFNTTATYIGSYSSSRGVWRHTSNSFNLGSGRQKIALFTIPENTEDFWYIMGSYIGTGTGTIQISIEGPVGQSYSLPEMYLFALDNLSASSSSYGMRIYGPDKGGGAQDLLFDSGYRYMDIIGFADISYTDTASTITNAVINSPTFTALIPGYEQEIFTGIPNTIASTVQIYRGGIKRIGSTLYSKKILISQYVEDAFYNLNYEYGSSTNLVFAVDAAPLGGTGSSGSGSGTEGISASIILNSGNTSCDFNLSTASSCSTTQSFTVSISGGNGTTISYAWSFLNGTSGFSFTTGTTSNTVTITNNNGSGTYTDVLECYVSQNGSQTQIATYNLSHTHTAITDPLSANVSVSNQVSSCSYLSSSGSTCTTSATYSLSTVTGGNGTIKSYLWELLSNTGGFTFTTVTNGTSVGITKTGSNGTYTATLRCTVSQSGMTSLVIDTPISHTHQAVTGSLVSPIPGASNTWSLTDTQYSSLTAEAIITLTVNSNGQATLSYNTGGEAISNWWSGAGTTPGTGVPGIGTYFWVRFTRTATTGSSSASTNTTGWLNLSTDRSVTVSASQSNGALGAVSNGATYTIEIASTSTGGSPISTTSNVILVATADSSPLPPP